LFNPLQWLQSLFEAALEKASSSFKAALPGLIKKQTVNESLRSGENSEFLSHPSVQPLVEVLEQQMDRKISESKCSTDNCKCKSISTRI